MTGFEMHTATLLVGVLYVVLPAFTWVVLGAERNRAGALWCLGGLAMGGSAVLVSTFTGTPYDFLSLSLVVLLNILSFAARLQSLRMEIGKPFPALPLVVSVLVCWLVFEFLMRVVGLYVPRAIYASLIFVFGSLLLARHAQIVDQKESSKAARWIALAYVGVALVYVMRILHLLRQDWSLTQGNITSDGIASVAVAVVMLLAAVIGHFGYLGLALERAQRKAVRYAEEQARQEVTQQLGQQIAVLERRQSLGQLAASIGHELNQPLTAILTNAQLARRGMQSGRIPPEGVQELLGKIEYNTQRASKILERIRNFMRSKDGEQTIFDLHKVVQDVIELMEGDVRSKDVRIEIGLVQGPVRIRGDALQVSQVLLNLLRNAMDSMALQPDRRVRIECQARNDRAVLTVRDWGPGLRTEDQKMVGSPFFSTKSQGLGMGLAISRTIARNHGGTLTLSNVPENQGPGAVATLDLPLVTDAEESEE